MFKSKWKREYENAIRFIELRKEWYELQAESHAICGDRENHKTRFYQKMALEDLLTDLKSLLEEG